MLSFNVKFVQTDTLTDGQTDNGKTICSRSFDAGGIKIRVQNILILPCFGIFA